MQRISATTSVILASASPRRRQLLRRSGMEFSVIPSGVDEEAISVTAPADYVRVLSSAKAKDVAQQYPDKWVIGADSIVVIDDTILGKPVSQADAKAMLSRLSGRTHRVLTGYSIVCVDRDHFFTDVAETDVLFKPLDDAEIEWYLDTPEPYDKAGAYAIQGIGAFMVERISGSYTNVVGLPVCEVIEHLYRQGVVRRVPVASLEAQDCQAI